MDEGQQYDFRAFTQKDVFECRLAGITPGFGYISNKKRRLFSEFLVRNGFLVSTEVNIHPKQPRPRTYGTYYRCAAPFAFTDMGKASVNTIVAIEGQCYMVTEKSCRVVHGWWTSPAGIDA